MGNLIFSHLAENVSFHKIFMFSIKISKKGKIENQFSEFTEIHEISILAPRAGAGKSTFSSFHENDGLILNSLRILIILGIFSNVSKNMGFPSNAGNVRESHGFH